MFYIFYVSYVISKYYYCANIFVLVFSSLLPCITVYVFISIGSSVTKVFPFNKVILILIKAFLQYS